MLSADFESITQQITERFKSLVIEDTERKHYPELLSVEQGVLAFIGALGRSMMEVFAAVRVGQSLEESGVCACGRRKEVLRRARWTCETLVGPVDVDDPYVYCRRCHISEHPAHAWLGAQRQAWTLTAQEAAVDLGADESCEKAVAKLARHHPGVNMGRTTALRLLHQHGAEARTFIQEKLDGAAARVASGVEPSSSAVELEAEYDAGMIPVATMQPIPVKPGEVAKTTPVRRLPVRKRAARWEEVKVGLVQKPGENTRLYALRPTGAVDDAFSDLLGLACLMGWTPATAVRGIADGAVYIRPRLEETFNQGTFRFILDRPHCKQHLHAAGVELAPRTGTAAESWAAEALKKMEAGRAAEVVEELEKAYLASGTDPASRNDALRLAAAYFHRNEDAVAYAEYREKGWGTASSEVESGHRHTVQVRMKIAGAWWHPDGVDDILALRMLKANGWWDEYWARQRQQWRTRAEQLADRHHAAA
jgi:hypothetical protein